MFDNINALSSDNSSYKSHSSLANKYEKHLRPSQNMINQKKKKNFGNVTFADRNFNVFFHFGIFYTNHKT